MDHAHGCARSRRGPRRDLPAARLCARPRPLARVHVAPVSVTEQQAGIRPRGGIPRLKPGFIPLLSYGFRPFFLGGAVWACAAMVLWIGVLDGHFTFATRYGALAWHAHELLFGYLSAIVTGFLLTA